ncbi:MAG: HAMP domain-containing sensor histidine kinase [Campylobacterota bacterium]|nr:HAMP domain-containing sensor histidine kinase [Campylobacterota bacterium]
MSVINDSGISLAENRTFRAFILLYILMSVLILLLLGSIYYLYKKEQMLSNHRLAMQLQGETYIPRLKRWMQGDDVAFPIDLAYRTALYDEHYDVIHSTLSESKISWKASIARDGNVIHFVVPLASYELGTHFLVFETTDDRLWLKETWMVAGGFGMLLMGLLLIVGWMLARLFLRPMKEAITLLDNFIKDTTHELNTPVSAILNNVELLDSRNLDDKSAKKIGRIAIAARTISTIYDDLTYLVLNHAVVIRNEAIDMSQLVLERLDYFETRYVQKKLRVETQLTADSEVVMDRTKATRLIDNLLSNAIKYNKIGGTIDVVLTQEYLQIVDTGRGIPKEKLDQVFERYHRADESVGGFGIGLNIVAMIAKEYDIRIEVDSKEDEGTAITLKWPSQ